MADRIRPTMPNRQERRPRSTGPFHQTSFTRTKRVSEFSHTPHESYLYRAIIWLNPPDSRLNR